MVLLVWPKQNRLKDIMWSYYFTSVYRQCMYSVHACVIFGGISASIFEIENKTPAHIDKSLLCMCKEQI